MGFDQLHSLAHLQARGPTEAFETFLKCTVFENFKKQIIEGTQEEVTDKQV